MPVCLPIRSWLRDYERIEALAVRLIYCQIACAIIGSVGALFNGVLLVNLVLALFGLVAIDSSCQHLGRTYAVLLLCAILLDIAWFILFCPIICCGGQCNRHKQPYKYAIDFGKSISSEGYEQYLVFSVRLTLVTQIIGFSIRFFSSFLFLQMYRLGVSSIRGTVFHAADFSARSGLLSPKARQISRDSSDSDESVGNSFYEPPTCLPCEGARKETCVPKDVNRTSGPNCESESATAASQQKVHTNGQYQIIQVDTAVPRPFFP